MQGAATTYNQNSTLPKPVYSVKKEQPKNCANYTYFGARYYDSDLSVWLSVDPLSDMYPSMSPYMYTAGNPVRLVDPNGMSIDDVLDGGPGKKGAQLKSGSLNSNLLKSNASITTGVNNGATNTNSTTSGTGNNQSKNNLAFQQPSAKQGALQRPSETLWSKPAFDMTVKGGYNLGAKAKAGIGPLKVGVGASLFQAAAGLNSANGAFSEVNVGSAELTLGPVTGGFSIFSAEYNFSNDEFEYSFFKPDWEVHGFSLSDNTTIEGGFSVGPVNLSARFDPIRSGAQNAVMVGSFAKFRAGETPPTPNFLIISFLLGL